MDAITGRLATETATLRARMEVLTRQSVSGMRADAYGDLAPEAPRALSLRAELGRREAYSRALDQSLGRTAAMQASLGRMGEIAREFGAGVARRLSSTDPSTLTAVPARAQAALREVAGLLNTRHVGEFLLSGTELTRAPIPAEATIGSGPMAAAVAGEVASLAPGNSAAVLAAIRGHSADLALSPFNAHLVADAALPPGSREAPRAVPSGDGEAIGYGVFAHRNSAAVPSPDPTSGGWAQDLLGSLMALASLTPAQLAAGPDFDRLAAGLSATLMSAHSALAEEQGVLGLTERRIEATRERHGTVTIALAKQLADIQEVNLADTLTRLQSTRTTLEASYRAIGALGELTLARFLN